MTEPTILNVVCPACELAWMLPLNARTYICPACEYVLLEKQAKEHQSAIYTPKREDAAAL